VSSLLPPLLQQQPAVSSLEFAIFIDGKAMMEEEECLMSDDFASLHVLHSDEAIDADDKVQRLLQQYPGQIHWSKIRSSSNRLAKSDLNAIGKFLVQQKKRLLRDNDNHNREQLVLRTQLHRLEQEASQLIAQEIAANPPKALMAVITPQSQHVGAWTGARRREFGAEGGGAPCPPEFLLKRDKRRDQDDTRSSSGPSRQHPGSNSRGGGDEKAVNEEVQDNKAGGEVDGLAAKDKEGHKS
jgi:hypothetical protein